MPDFLDSLIGRASAKAPVLRPRTPGLFEPLAAGYGPGGRLNAAAGFTQSDVPDLGRADRPASDVLPKMPRRPDTLIARPAGQAMEPALNRASAAVRDDRFRGQTPAQAAQRGSEADRLGETERASRSANLEPAAQEQLITRLRTLEHLAAQRVAARPSPFLTPPRLAPAGASAAGDAPAGPGFEQAFGGAGGAVRQEPASPGPTGPPATAADGVQAGPRADRLERLTMELDALRQLSTMTHSPSGPAPSLAVVMKPIRPAAIQAPPAIHPPRESAPLQIQVTIGEVQVRATSAPAPRAAEPRASRGATPLSLDEYLRRRNGGAA